MLHYFKDRVDCLTHFMPTVLFYLVIALGYVKILFPLHGVTAVRILLLISRNFPVILSEILFKVVITFESSDEIPKCFSNKRFEAVSFPVISSIY